MDIFLNGKMVPHEQAMVPFDDAGLQHAVGLFETFQCFHGRVFRLTQHLERLRTSAIQLGLLRELHLDPLAQAVEQTIEHNQLDRARIRLTLTAGAASMLRASENTETSGGGGGTLMIVPTPATAYDPAYFERGVRVLIAPAGANPFDQLAVHKSLSYWGRLRTLRQAAAAGAGEAIWMNISNHIASGAISNVFLVRDGVLFTPIARGEEQEGAMPAPVLPGVTRAAVMELAREMNVEVRTQMLSIHDLLDADEAFLTNSGWQVLPISHVEQKEIGEGGAGELTRALRTRLLELIEAETAGGE